MTTEQKIIKTKVGVLELSKQLGNVSRVQQGFIHPFDSPSRNHPAYEIGVVSFAVH